MHDYTAKDEVLHLPYINEEAPVNVFVGLDDPEAISFIRGGLGGSEDRRQELKDQLEAGNEWMSMNGLEPSKTSPGDIEIASGLSLDGIHKIRRLLSICNPMGGGPRIEDRINNGLENKESMEWHKGLTGAANLCSIINTSAR